MRHDGLSTRFPAKMFRPGARSLYQGPRHDPGAFTGNQCFPYSAERQCPGPGIDGHDKPNVAAAR